MRSSIRLALPALLAATALTLTACGGDDDADSGNDNASGSQESNGGATEEESEAPAEETPAEEPAAEEGTVPEIDDLRGDWYVDPDDQENSHNLAVYGDEEIIFIEDMTAEGDLCSAGTYADGVLTVTDCMMGGDDRSAELSLADDGTLNVTWDNGESESYTNTVTGGAAAGFTEDIYEQFLGDLDELTAGLGG
ncbi:hypothetical protein ACL02R_29050 [Streptomyces sp. MS19]|uniref:hypothetical protein n=1 Tax=Streptomyces sp. MS19 TaxID=3385972 RepID=UPI00399F616A